MILYDTTFVDGVSYAKMISESEDADRRFTAALQGVDLKDDGGVTTHGKTPLRRFHDKVTNRLRGR